MINQQILLLGRHHMLLSYHYSEQLRFGSRGPNSEYSDRRKGLLYT